MQPKLVASIFISLLIIISLAIPVVIHESGTQVCDSKGKNQLCEVHGSPVAISKSYKLQAKSIRLTKAHIVFLETIPPPTTPEAPMAIMGVMEIPTKTV
jgi:hypothetical protein